MLFRLLTFAAFAWVAFLPVLPSLNLIAAIAVVIVYVSAFVLPILKLAARVVLLKKLAAVGLGLWAVTWGAWQLQSNLPSSYEGKNLRVDARVVSAKPQPSGGQRLDVKVLQIVDEQGRRLSIQPIFFRLQKGRSHFFKTDDPDVESFQQPWREGEVWRFWARLKRPHGFANPGGFDYERWLLARRIHATGYIKYSESMRPVRLPDYDSSFLQWRASLKRQLRNTLGEGRVVETLLALAMGEKQGLSQSDNQLLQKAGLSHLLAISGLHVGLAAGFGLLLGRMLGGVVAVLIPFRSPGPMLGIALALLVAGTYAAVAGFSLATQRALVMLVIAAIWTTCYRRFSPWLAWWWAMLVVLCLQPLSLFEPGFWFSFLAVAILLLVLRWKSVDRWSTLVAVFKAQCALFIGLFVVQWFLGVPVSILSPLINLFAIPFVSLLVVPFVLAGLLIAEFDWQWSGVFWWCAELTMSWFWIAVDWLEPLVQVTAVNVSYQPSLIQLVVALLFLFWLLIPLAWPARLLAVSVVLVWLLPIDKGLHSEPEVTVLDVGQGLSVLVRDGNQTLLYDVGPRYSPEFNAGEAVLTPFLDHLGIERIQHGVISHWDTDHSGGLDGFGVVVGHWLASADDAQQVSLLSGVVESCDQDRQFSVGRWQVSVLGYGQAQLYSTRNDLSCVLLLELDGFRVLLPGDVERVREMRLLSHEQLQKPVDVMVAPHHGSGTSSSEAWVSQLRPRWVVYSSGYRNRYRHPQSKVRQRYRRWGSKSFNTARNGAVRFWRSKSQVEWQVEGFRQAEPRYWRNPQADGEG